MLGAVSLTCEREDAEHDQHGAGNQRQLDRLVEDRECDRDGDERPGSAMTAAREAPTSFTAMTYKSCEPPGAMSPVAETAREPLR